MASLRAAAEAGNDPEGLPEYRGEDVNIRVSGDFAVIAFRLAAGTAARGSAASAGWCRREGTDRAGRLAAVLSKGIVSELRSPTLEK